MLWFATQEIIKFSRRLKFTFGSPVHSTFRSENYDNIIVRTDVG